jgi:hypothetical protein
MTRKEPNVWKLIGAACVCMAMAGCGRGTEGASDEKALVAVSEPIVLQTNASSDQDTPHVLYINVNKALDDLSFGKALDYVRAKIGVVTQGATLNRSLVAELAADPTAMRRRFTARTVLVVFIERNPEGYTFLQAPRYWGMVNVHNFDQDQSDSEIRESRLRKLFLKGLVHAAGGGVNPDRRCVMWDGGTTLEGLDKTSVTLGPFALFPLQKTLRELGGDGIMR